MKCLQEGCKNIDHAYMMKPLRKSFRTGEHIHVPGGWCTPTPQGQELLCAGPFLTLPCAFLNLAVRLYFLLCDKPVHVFP